MLFKLTILKEQDTFAARQLSLGDLCLLKEIDNTAVWVLLPNVTIFKEDDEVAVRVLFSPHTRRQSGDSLALILGDQLSILLLR